MSTAPECQAVGCSDKPHGQGYCNRHYKLLRTAGELQLIPKLSPEERFWSHVDKSGECWEWTANKTKRGYGAWSIGGRSVMPHRYSYELVKGPIPAGMQIDHLCHRRACVRPEHLRVATSKQNNENPSGIRTDNTSGYRGVTRHAKNGRWYAAVQHNGRKYGAGGYATPEEAAEAARQKRLSLFTHNEADRRSA